MAATDDSCDPPSSRAYRRLATTPVRGKDAVGGDSCSQIDSPGIPFADPRSARKMTRHVPLALAGSTGVGLLHLVWGRWVWLPAVGTPLSVLMAIGLVVFMVAALLAAGIAAARTMHEAGRAAGWRTAGVLAIAYSGPAAIFWAVEAAISTVQNEAACDEMVRAGELLPTEEVLQSAAQLPGAAEAAGMALLSVAATGLVGFLAAGAAATLAHILASSTPLADSL